jgi:hypothetical protein
MSNYRIAAVLLGGLFLAPAAMAQSTHLAFATGEPRSEYLVFLDKGNQVPPSATPMVSKAVSAAKAGKTVMVVGRLDHAQVVKQEMLRDGAPSTAIILANDPGKALPKVDALSDASNRKVEIKF